MALEAKTEAAAEATAEKMRQDGKSATMQRFGRSDSRENAQRRKIGNYAEIRPRVKERERERELIHLLVHQNQVI